MATSRTDYHLEAVAAGVTFYPDANDLCEEHPEVVVLATSILSLEAVLSTLPVGRLKRSTLFVDVLSVKEFPKRLMLSLLPPEASSPLPGCPVQPGSCANAGLSGSMGCYDPSVWLHAVDWGMHAPLHMVSFAHCLAQKEKKALWRETDQ